MFCCRWNESIATVVNPSGQLLSSVKEQSTNFSEPAGDECSKDRFSMNFSTEIFFHYIFLTLRGI